MDVIKSTFLPSMSPSFFFPLNSLSEIQVQAVIWIPHRLCQPAAAVYTHTRPPTRTLWLAPHSPTLCLVSPSRREASSLSDTSGCQGESQSKEVLCSRHTGDPLSRPKTQRRPEKLPSLFIAQRFIFIPLLFYDQTREMGVGGV